MAAASPVRSRQCVGRAEWVSTISSAGTRNMRRVGAARRRTRASRLGEGVNRPMHRARVETCRPRPSRRSRGAARARSPRCRDTRDACHERSVRAPGKSERHDAARLTFATLAKAMQHDDVLDRAAAWRADGLAVAIATVVRTWGESPRPAGSKLVDERARRVRRLGVGRLHRSGGDRRSASDHAGRSRRACSSSASPTRSRGRWASRAAVASRCTSSRCRR